MLVCVSDVVFLTSPSVFLVLPPSASGGDVTGNKHHSQHLADARAAAASLPTREQGLCLRQSVVVDKRETGVCLKAGFTCGGRGGASLPHTPGESV